jgi:hypothetical protein
MVGCIGTPPASKARQPTSGVRGTVARSVPDFGALKWVVTATPKSGTKNTSKWMASLGYPSGHERVFHAPYPNDPTRPRIHDTRRVSDVSWLAAPYTTELRAAGVKVIHLHRPHPDIVESLLRRKQFDLSRPPFGPVVEAFTSALDYEPFSRRQYEVFVEEWISLIDADATWDLHDLDPSMLTDL